MRYILILTGILGSLSSVFLICVSPAQALTVSPAKIEITADPGQTAEGEIEIFNEQDVEKIFFLSHENFEPRGDSGAPYFIGAKDGLATWITSTESVTIKPGERINVPYSIKIPESTSPGGYFAAIFFGSQAPSGSKGGEVSIGGKIGVLVLLRVAGEVEEGGGLLDFKTTDDKKFYTSLPVRMEYRFNNTGADRVVPLGDIVIKNTFRMTSARLLVNENEGSVLPGSTRKFTVLWGTETEEDAIKKGFFATAFDQIKDFRFGWYTAEANFTWGAIGLQAGSSYNFFIIPWQLLTIVFSIILIFGSIFIIALKKYNKFIISQALRK